VGGRVGGTLENQGFSQTPLFKFFIFKGSTSEVKKLRDLMLEWFSLMICEKK
jgi:hypothetical protein